MSQIEKLFSKLSKYASKARDLTSFVSDIESDSDNGFKEEDDAGPKIQIKRSNSQECVKNFLLAPSNPDFHDLDDISLNTKPLNLKISSQPEQYKLDKIKETPRTRTLKVLCNVNEKLEPELQKNNSNNSDNPPLQLDNLETNINEQKAVSPINNLSQNDEANLSNKGDGPNLLESHEPGLEQDEWNDLEEREARVERSEGILSDSSLNFKKIQNQRQPSITNSSQEKNKKQRLSSRTNSSQELENYEEELEDEDKDKDEEKTEKTWESDTNTSSSLDRRNEQSQDSSTPVEEENTNTSSPSLRGPASSTSQTIRDTNSSEFNSQGTSKSLEIQSFKESAGCSDSQSLKPGKWEDKKEHESESMSQEQSLESGSSISEEGDAILADEIEEEACSNKDEEKDEDKKEEKGEKSSQTSSNTSKGTESIQVSQMLSDQNSDTTKSNYIPKRFGIKNNKRPKARKITQVDSDSSDEEKFLLQRKGANELFFGKYNDKKIREDYANEKGPLLKRTRKDFNKPLHRKFALNSKIEKIESSDEQSSFIEEVEQEDFTNVKPSKRVLKRLSKKRKLEDRQRHYEMLERQELQKKKILNSRPCIILDYSNLTHRQYRMRRTKRKKEENEGKLHWDKYEEDNFVYYLYAIEL